MFFRKKKGAKNLAPKNRKKRVIECAHINIF